MRHVADRVSPAANRKNEINLLFDRRQAFRVSNFTCFSIKAVTRCVCAHRVTFFMRLPAPSASAAAGAAAAHTASVEAAGATAAKAAGMAAEAAGTRPGPVSGVRRMVVIVIPVTVSAAYGSAKDPAAGDQDDHDENKRIHSICRPFPPVRETRAPVSGTFRRRLRVSGLRRPNVFRPMRRRKAIRSAEG